MPSSSSARMTRIAISPLLATKTLVNTAGNPIACCPFPRRLCSDWVVRRIAGTVAALCALALLPPATSGAAVTWKRCQRGDVSQCATLPVPLDRSGKVGGSVDLHVERVRTRDQPAKVTPAGGTPPHGAIVALAGGPGQPA